MASHFFVTPSMCNMLTIIAPIWLWKCGNYRGAIVSCGSWSVQAQQRNVIVHRDVIVLGMENSLKNPSTFPSSITFDWIQLMMISCHSPHSAKLLPKDTMSCRQEKQGMNKGHWADVTLGRNILERKLMWECIQTQICRVLWSSP